MRFARTALLVSVMTAFAPGIYAAPAPPSINDMTTCQGLLDFVGTKLDWTPAKYGSSDVSAVRVGLEQYDDYIQREIVTPGLIKFNKGDNAKAAAMQKQVDTYKAQVVTGLNSAFPGARLYTDQAIGINDCAKKAMPTGQALENLKVALHKIIELAKQ